MPMSMPELVKDVDDPSRIETLLVSRCVKCSRRGTVRPPRECSRCRVCGEPVIVWRWVL